MNDLDIKENRAKLGKSQEELAEMLGVSLRTIQNWEAGKVIPKSKYAILRSIFKEEEKGTGPVSQPSREYEPNGTINIRVSDMVEILKTLSNSNAQLIQNNATLVQTNSELSKKIVAHPGDNVICADVSG